MLPEKAEGCLSCLGKHSAVFLTSAKRPVPVLKLLIGCGWCCHGIPYFPLTPPPSGEIEEVCAFFIILQAENGSAACMPILYLAYGTII